MLTSHTIEIESYGTHLYIDLKAGATTKLASLIVALVKATIL